MGRNEARKQKQLAKKKAKRVERRTQLARRKSDNPAIRLAGVGRLPIIGAWVPDNLWQQGLGDLVLARRQPDGEIVCATFLVDTFCLGVKNAFWRVMSSGEFEALLQKFGQHGRLEKVTPECLAKIVHGAVDYAHSFGFSPHPDYRHARQLLDGIDPAQCPDRFAFGKNGKPFYIRGPHESIEKARAISNRILDAGGDYVIPTPDLRELAGELEDWGEDDFEEDDFDDDSEFDEEDDDSSPRS
jgi:hypothetical protein